MPKRAAFLGLLLLSGPAWADDWEAGIRFGLHSGGVREDLLAPIGYGGAGLRFGGVVDAALGPGDLWADMDLGARIAANRYGHLVLTVDHQIDLAYTFRMGSGPWFPGFGLTASWDARMSYYESWDDAHGYWLGAQWLGPAGRLRGPIGRAELDIGLGVALIGGAGRPPEYRWEKQDPLKQFGFWFAGPVKGEAFYAVDHLQVVTLDTSVHLPHPEGTAGRWSVGLDLRHVRLDQPVTTVDLSATLWMARTWGTR